MIIGRTRKGRRRVGLREIVRQRQFRKHQEGDAFALRGPQGDEMSFEIGRYVAGTAFDLGCGNSHGALSDSGSGERTGRPPTDHIRFCDLRSSVETSSTVFLSTSTEALSFAIVASSSFAERPLRMSASLGFLSSVSLRTTGVSA